MSKVSDNLDKMSGEELQRAYESQILKCEWLVQDRNSLMNFSAFKLADDIRLELLRRLNDYERLKKRVEDATTGWESYAWKNGEYIDSVQKYFDDWKEGAER